MTMKEIARLANVSSATVSKILNGKDQHISETTRKRVLEIVEREGYIPNAVAKSLKIKKTKTLGIIIPDVTNQFFSELARGIEDAAEKEGYSVILCNSDNKIKKEERYLQVLQEKMVDGIILTASEQGLTRSLERRNTPMVLLDRDILLDRKIGRIIVDNLEGAYLATSHLLDKGSKEIAFISSRNTGRSSGERLEGYKKALKERGIKLREDLIFLGEYSIDTGYKGTLEILEKTKIDGICCGNDLIAIGAINALTKKGIQIPKDIRIVGFDDIQMAQYVNPPLTTIRQPIREMGEEAVKMLIAIIEKKSKGEVKVLKTKLVERRTS